MNNTAWSSLALAVGVLLMLAAPLIAGLVPAQAAWTDDDQRALQTASAEYHAALHDHQHGTHARASASSAVHEHHAHAEEARLEYEQQQSRLAAAQARERWLVWGARLAGVVLAGLGVWGYVQSRR